MKHDADRRSFLRLASLLSVYFVAGHNIHAADTSTPHHHPLPQPVEAGTAPGSADGQNLYALQGTSNFKAIYGDPQLRAAFLLFLQNVFHLYPDDRLHALIGEITTTSSSDREIYERLQARLPGIKPAFSDATYALPALWKQKAEMSRQTLALLGSSPRINGYLELGTTGRYISRLRSDIEISGNIVLVHTVAPGYSPIDIVERGQLSKIGRYVPLNDYAAVSSGDVADESLDVVANFIGFHHSPPEKRDRFVASLHRVLRQGGRMILRDHDVSSPQMNRMAALAHDVFNMGISASWSANEHEIRNFTSLADQIPYLESLGFRKKGPTLLQDGDPTHNALMEFVRV